MVEKHDLKHAKRNVFGEVKFKSVIIILYLIYAFLSSIPLPLWRDGTRAVLGESVPSIQFFPWIELRAFSSPLRNTAEIAEGRLKNGKEVVLNLNRASYRPDKKIPTKFGARSLMSNPTFAQAFCDWHLKNYNSHVMAGEDKLESLSISIGEWPMSSDGSSPPTRKIFIVKCDI